MRIWALLVLVAGCNSGATSCAKASSGASGEADSPIRALVCSQGGKRLGTLRFPEGGAPALTLEAGGAEGEAFKVSWEKLLAKGKIRVKIHQDRDDERALVGFEGAPGEASYGYVVLLKMAEDYGYACDPEPAAD